MKKIFPILALILCTLRMNAATLQVTGDLKWDITEPRLTFKLVGGLKNTSPGGTTSGTLKLVLWAGQIPTARTYNIGEYNLGQLGGGQQFSSFSVKTTPNVPTVSGKYYFTIAVLEYTTGGWFNRLLIQTGPENLLAGNFKDQVKWKIPTAKVTPPVPALVPGQRLQLTLKATEYLNQFPTEYQSLTSIFLDSTTKATVKTLSGKSTAAFTYKIDSSKLNSKKVSVGSLYLDYSNSTSYATITLFFQGVSSGTYKSVETVASKPETTWGTFSLR
jgi:hypothetical protein